jgi:hypothetical protein
MIRLGKVRVSAATKASCLGKQQIMIDLQECVMD